MADLSHQPGHPVTAAVLRTAMNVTFCNKFQKRKYKIRYLFMSQILIWVTHHEGVHVLT